DLQPPPIGVRERPRRPGGPREQPIPEEPEQLGRPRLGAPPLRAGSRRAQENRRDSGPRPAVRADQHVLGHGHLIEEALVLERASDAEAGDPMGGEADELPAAVVERDPAGRRRVDAGDQVEDGRLSGAVGPDEADDLALLHLEAEIVYGPEAAEVFRQAVGFERSEEHTSELQSLAYVVC